MAREVNTVLAQIIAEGRGVSEAKGEEIVKNMRSANQYQVCSGYLLLPVYSIGERLLTEWLAGGRLVIKKESIAERHAAFGFIGGDDLSGFTAGVLLHYYLYKTVVISDEHI
jgi:hypothetical protein